MQFPAEGASFHRSRQGVYDPVGAKTLDTLVQTAGHGEIEGPFMGAIVELVGLVLRCVGGKDIVGFGEKVALIRYGLGRHGIDSTPSVHRH